MTDPTSVNPSGFTAAEIREIGEYGQAIDKASDFAKQASSGQDSDVEYNRRRAALDRRLAAVRLNVRFAT